MQIFMLVNGHNQNGVTRVQKVFGKLEPPLHHCKPLAVTIFVACVDIIVVVLPIACSGVIRRVNVNAIDLSAVKIFEQLECMIIVSLNERRAKAKNQVRYRRYRAVEDTDKSRRRIEQR